MFEATLGTLHVLFLLLLFGHFVADYGLSNNWISDAKNPFKAYPGVPWQIVMGSHAGIHGGMVGIITGVWWLGVIEFVAHFFIDWGRCVHKYNFTVDQIMHWLCKLIYVSIIAVMLMN